MIWDKLFSWGNKEEEPDIRFGRYSDAYKTDEQYASWEKAVTAFEAQQYTESYRYFFDYLRDEMSDDKAKHKILPPSKFGLIQITRQRVRPEMNIKT
ncbi:MAG: ribonuclease E/G, partial [Chitinophagales bacterium]